MIWLLWLVALVGLMCAGALTPEAPCGEEIELDDWRETDVVSADLRRVVEVRRRGGRWAASLDGELLREGVDEIGHVGFLADGTPHLAWRRGERWWQQVGDRAWGPYAALGPLVTEGPRHAFASLRGRRWQLVVNGREGASWDELGAVHLSGEHHALTVRQDDVWITLVDDMTLGAAEQAHVLDLHGASALWAARRDGVWSLRLDRQTLPGEWSAVGPGWLGASGWRVFTADEAGWWVLADDAIEGPSSGRPLGFTEDGRPLFLEYGHGERLRVGEQEGAWVEELELLHTSGPEPVWLGRDAHGWSLRRGAWRVQLSERPAAVAVSDSGELVALARPEGEIALHRVGDAEPLLVEAASPVDVQPHLALDDTSLRYLHRRDDRVLLREVPLDCLPGRAPVRSNGRGPAGPLFGSRE